MENTVSQQVTLDEVFSGLDESATSKFYSFHSKYPNVYKMFKKLTFKAIKRGFKNYGAKGVMELVRWHTAGPTKEDGFKINNNYTSYYVRLFEKEHPEHIGFFRKRKIKQELT
ncbi:hypothetical protein [Flagellimonas nanhaiensis]|uniref:Uncharacterized protein n=1 Tax=Flagellimonas nanhaiensis TaxID=2292706 RepID=A0A371JMU8_9FLAO|nr:hypothetical protein [Allomuricauda nanhaiensis]RDY58474.1 hypothetical protein DX873_15855 [Allomuricauda nanhaiensis]